MMKLNYSLHNVCGSIYSSNTSANLLFSKDGNLLYSPVRNRIILFDLLHHTSATLHHIETYKEISYIAMNHENTLLVAVDVDGRAAFINLLQHRILFEHH